MAGYELKDGNGSLFRNDRKTMDTHADYTGTVKIGGQEYYLNAWLKEGNNGRFFSLSLKPKGNTTQQVKPPSNTFHKTFHEDLDDSLPPF